ncbi:MAG: hypothetical protein EGR93_11125 [Prevotella sp.]|nr:hypothetical protein [Prevotella sp.]
MPYIGIQVAAECFCHNCRQLGNIIS